MTNRQKISERLLSDLAVVWDKHGAAVLESLAVTDPGKLAQIAYGLLARDIFVSVANTGPSNVTADAWALMRPVLDLIEQNVPAGSDPAEVFDRGRAALALRQAHRGGLSGAAGGGLQRRPLAGRLVVTRCRDRHESTR
jgi:hypothetical protein